MFKKKNQIIIAIHDDTVCWIMIHGADGGPHMFQLPIEQVLSDANIAARMPEWLKGNHHMICIIPDHWFGSQRYPFQSKKPSLIVPFLEHKLAAAYPAQKAIRNFFNYRHVAAHDDRNLFAIFLQEDKCYQLYTALNQLGHTPRYITSLAFLWEERLRQVASEFNQKGTLLIHLTGQACRLYFYFRGHYLFSRSVMVTNAVDELDSLGFEINQSLYMFSQKAKSDLDHIYMLCDAPQSRINLGRILGRDIIDLQPIAAQTQDTAISPELPMLDGLHRSQINSAPGFFSIVHRQVKQAMAWKPVQWAGICIGLIVLVGLSGEHFLLRRTLVDAGSDYRTVQQQIIRDAPEMALSEYSSTLEQMLDMAEQSVLVDTVHQLPAGFPAHVQLKELDLDLESTPRMKISARVHAHDAVELQTVLIRLIDQLKVKLKSAQAMTLNDIDIRLEQPATGITPNRYQIAFQLELL